VPLSPESVSRLEELFSVVPGTQIRRMFGGVGVFRHGLMYALGTSDGAVALKADAETVPAFEAEGCREWVYEMKGVPKGMGYWYIPERLFDEPEELRNWALAAFDAAARADARKPVSQRKLRV